MYNSASVTKTIKFIIYNFLQFVDYDSEEYDETKPVPDFASVYFFTKSKHGWIPNDTVYSVPSMSISQMTGKIEEIQMSSTRKCYKFEAFPGLDM